MIPSRHTNNIHLGAGHVRFAPTREDGAHIALPFGDSPGFALQVNTQRLEDFTSDGQTAEHHLDVVTQISRAAQLVVKNLALRNLGYWLMADLEEISQSSGSVTEEAHTAVLGGYLQLGVDEDHPTGARSVEDISVVDADTGMTTYVAGEDYHVDFERAQILIDPDGDIDEGEALEIDYDTTAVIWDQLATHGRGPQVGELWYIGDETQGENRVLFAPRALLAAEGDLQMKSRDTVAQMTFSCRFQSPGDGRAALYLGGMPVASA